MTNSRFAHTDLESGQQVSPNNKFDNEDSEQNFVDSAEVNIVDNYARIFFPLTYFLYNVGYWAVYLTV